MSGVKRYAFQIHRRPHGLEELRYGNLVRWDDYDRLEQERAEQWRLRRDAEADRDTANAVAAELRAQVEAMRACGWVNAVDQEMICSHIGVASADDSYDQARSKLASLIEWHVMVATDPAVNGGFAMVPVEPTMAMRRAAQDRLAEEGLAVSDWLICTAHAALVDAALQAKP